MEDANSVYSGISELADAEQGLLNYYSNIIDLVARSFPSNNTSISETSVLEFGAGTGFLSGLLQEKFNVKADCLEIDPTLIEILHQKGFNTYSKLTEIDKKYDLIFTSNVLEHIEDDRKSLRDIRAIMQVGGKLAIYVPALPFLFSDMDAQVGHYRRYKRKELIEKVQESGFTVEKCYWNDCIGVAAWFSLKILGYKGKVGIGSKKSLVIYDKFVYPISKILDKLFFKKIIGKNLFLFAKAK